MSQEAKLNNENIILFDDDVSACRWYEFGVDNEVKKYANPHYYSFDMGKEPVDPHYYSFDMDQEGGKHE